MNLEVISITSVQKHRSSRDYQLAMNVGNFEHKFEEEQDLDIVSKYLSKDYSLFIWEKMLTL